MERLIGYENLDEKNLHTVNGGCILCKIGSALICTGAIVGAVAMGGIGGVIVGTIAVIGFVFTLMG